MTTISRQGKLQHRVKTTSHVERGYSDSRRAYDQRRRRVPLDAMGKLYKKIVQGDPCSLCGGHCGQMAADHIVPLDKGGRNEWENLTAAGRPCNAAKKSKSLLMFLLERKPA